MARAVIIEGSTLEDCKAKAVQLLGAPIEKINVRIVQRGRKGLFASRPFRIQASLKLDASEARGKSSPFLSKLNTHVSIALTEMERVEALHGVDEKTAFEEVMASYEDLPDERRQEVLELSKLLSGPTARKIQEQVSKDGWFSARASDDRLGAFVSISPPEGIGRPVTVRDVLGRLRGMGISQGVDHVKIRKLVGEVVELGRPLKDVRIATGRPPEPGTDGRIEFLEASSGRESVTRADGSVDHRGKTRITVVRKDQVLARLVPHTEGAAGVTVFGEELKPTPGKRAHLEAGNNAVFDPERGEYRSEIDGLLKIEGDTVYVRKTFAVPGDVNMSTGNIEFNGTVEVMGSVHDGFSVRATEDIEIEGGVEGCEIVSEKGSVRIKQGVAGRNRCFISAGKDVEAKYIENARVYARENVRVDVAIMHSEIVAGDSVLATKGKGSIIGGLTKAGNLVKALVLGAPSEPPTELLVGISIQDQDQIREMDRRMVGLQNAAMHLEKVTKEFEHAARNIDKLPAAEKEQYVGLRKKLVVLHHEIDKIQSQRTELMEKLTAEARGLVKISREVHGRVVVRIGQFIDRVKRTLHGASFRADPEQGRIVRGH